MNGTIVRIVSEKGFGFIRSNDSGVEYFFHRSAVKAGTFERLERGQKVTFEGGDGPKGPRAEDVRVG